METLLAGKRVLIVEDESLVAELVADIADDMSAERVGIVATVGQALKSLAAEPWDLAILDYNLQGTPSWPVAEALRERGIPYLIVSGYGQDLVTEPNTPLLAKPYSVADFVAAIRRVSLAPPAGNGSTPMATGNALGNAGTPPATTPRLR